jgi:formylglycine-generating enzyme required for sulfatase activity
MHHRARIVLFLMATMQAKAVGAHDADPHWQPIGPLLVHRHEVTVGEFREFVEATGHVTTAERDGGGLVYEAGWTHKPGWTWRAPYGEPADADEPAVHVTFDDALAYCRHAGGRLPTDEEWVDAAYREQRPDPAPGFETGRVYPYPTGERPLGANCLQDCGVSTATDRSDVLTRGRGHALAGSTRTGVNGLFDMGANVWEWVNTGSARKRRTRGGSWWYGADRMQRDHLASKPRDMAVVYIGFRCVKDR